MSKVYIRVKGQEFPYVVEDASTIIDDGAFLKFDTTSKKGVTRHVELAKSEVASKETVDSEE